jgi:hypothetical protein
MSLPVQIVPIKTFVGIGMQLPTFRANALRLELLLIILLTCHADLYRKLKKMEEHFSFFHSCTHTLWRILRNHNILPYMTFEMMKSFSMFKFGARSNFPLVLRHF